MKTKALALLLCVITVVSLLTGCVRSDIGIKLEGDGTGSVSATIGIEKEFYEQFMAADNPFEGKTASEFEYDGKTYVSFTETTDYGSFEEIEKALLEMKYQTDELEYAQDKYDISAAEDETVGNESDAVNPNSDEITGINTDTRVFKSVKIEKKSGLFYTAYTFKATMNPQKASPDYDVSDIFKVTLSIEMPTDITEASGGKVDGKSVTFDIEDITEETQLAVTSESNNVGVVIGIVAALVILMVVFFLIFRGKNSNG